MKLLRINPDGTLSLPKELCSRFLTSDALIALEEDNAIIIKRLTPSFKLSDLPKLRRGKSISLKTAVREVHRSRKQ